MLVNIPKLGDAQLYGYSYDQLNRLTAMNAYTGLNSGNNSFVPVGSTNYKERVSYDGNGNILSYLRNGEGANTSMDNLSYAYNLSGGWLQNNKLRHVTDAVTTTPGGYGDLKNGQANDNYGYDAIGNLVKDESEGIADGGIEWNVYGKISQITKTNGGVTTVIKYTYDATGNRIGKWVQVGAGTPRQTAYVRDASGNVMAIYEKGGAVNGGLLSQIEVPLYGSSRLGIWRPDREVETTGWELFDTDPLTGTNGGIVGGWERGQVQFELSNHLGNVLVMISDVRIPVLVPEGIELCDDQVHPACYRPIDYYLPQVLTANDYYPFGMIMPGRKFAEGEYRYGFNGQEKSTEIDPAGNSMMAEFWQYDARLGMRWNVDRRSVSGFSPYATFRNNPIFFIDIKGDTTYPTPNGGSVYTEDPGVQLFDGSSHSITGSEIKVTPAKGTLKSFTIRGPYARGGAARFIAIFGTKTGKFLGYGWDKDLDYTYDDFLEDFKKNLLENIEHSDDPMWDTEISEEESRNNTLNLGLAVTLPSVLLRPLTIATNVGKIVNSSVGRTVSEFLDLFKPIDGLDFTKTIYRGTTGKESGRTILFLTDNAEVAATYIKNGGQVMQYEMTPFSLTRLYQSGEMTYRTGKHGMLGVTVTEYVFTGENLVEALNLIAKPYIP